MSIWKKTKDELDYIWYRISSFYYSVKSYIKQNIIRKPFWNVIYSAFNSYPWDYGYEYDLEEAKLKEMLAYHKRSHIVVEESRQHKIKTLSLALKMLYIIKNETDYFDYVGDIKFTPIKETDENGETLYTSNLDELQYICKVNVNQRNYQRFRISKEILEMHPHELYIAKAHYLYHKIRYYYEQEWWD